MVSPRIVPAVAIGSFVGAGLATAPVGCLTFALPFFAWSYWRLILWKTQPATREVSAATWIGAATPILAVVLMSLSSLRPVHDVRCPFDVEPAGIRWR